MDKGLNYILEDHHGDIRVHLLLGLPGQIQQDTKGFGVCSAIETVLETVSAHMIVNSLLPEEG